MQAEGACRLHGCTQQVRGEGKGHEGGMEGEGVRGKRGRKRGRGGREEGRRGERERGKRGRGGREEGKKGEGMRGEKG